MDAPKADMADAIKRLARASEDRLSSHPDAADLVAYHRGETTPEASEELQAHLELCRECTSLLLDLAELETEPAPPDENTEAAWEELSRHLPNLRSEISSAEPAATVTPLARPAAKRPPRSTWAMAAALFATLAVAIPWISGLLHSVETLTHQVETLTLDVQTLARPHWDTLVVDVNAESNLRTDDPADSGEAHVIELGSGQAIFTLVLHPTGNPQFPEYHGRILDAEGRELSSQSIVQNDFGTFVVTLSRHSLPEGDFQIEISGATEGTRTLIETFPLRLAPAPSD